VSDTGLDISIMTGRELIISSFGNYITEALKEAKCKYPFKLINIRG